MHVASVTPDHPSTPVPRQALGNPNPDDPFSWSGGRGTTPGGGVLRQGSSLNGASAGIWLTGWAFVTGW